MCNRILFVWSLVFIFLALAVMFGCGGDEAEPERAYEAHEVEGPCACFFQCRSYFINQEEGCRAGVDGTAGCRDWAQEQCDNAGQMLEWAECIPDCDSCSDCSPSEEY